MPAFPTTAMASTVALGARATNPRVLFTPRRVQPAPHLSNAKTTPRGKSALVVRAQQQQYNGNMYNMPVGNREGEPYVDPNQPARPTELNNNAIASAHTEATAMIRAHEEAQYITHATPTVSEEDRARATHEHNVHAATTMGQDAHALRERYSGSLEPEYIADVREARAKHIDLEARAVQERDYVTASTSAAILRRLVEIETDLLVQETKEMESSLSQEYAEAALAKRRKDALLQELRDINLGDVDGRYGDMTANVKSNVAPKPTTKQPGSESGAEGDAQEGDDPDPRDPAPINATVPVRLSVNVKTVFGEGVVVCGDISELGAWDAAAAPKMEYQKKDGTWSTTVHIPQGSVFKFKFVVEGGLSEKDVEKGERGEMHWQEGNDRKIQLPIEGDALSLDVVCDWEGDESKERMWLCTPVPNVVPV